MSPAKLQISARIHTVWSGSSLASFLKVKDTKDLHVDNGDDDLTARMCRLILSSMVAHDRRYIFSHCSSCRLVC